MRLFKCQNCGQALYFENTKCESCGMRLGYLPQLATLSAMVPEDGAWRPLASGSEPRLFCSNAVEGACNWTVPVVDGGADAFCAACRHNHVIPDTGLGDNRRNWLKLEQAKHRLFYSLVRLCLPLRDRVEDPAGGLAFDFLADDGSGRAVTTGHDDGLITIALKEADDVERERMREHLGEPYRTLLGHFRHEIAHYFWDRLIEAGGRLEDCRAVFGDHDRHYRGALDAHYRDGPPADWQTHYVSAYASAHPWEDWAETFAHYLHIVDTLETAGAFGLAVHPTIDPEGALSTAVGFDPYREPEIGRIVDAWLPLAFAVNSMNRSMGQPDLYPFVLTPAVIGKLGFVHEIVRAASTDLDHAAPTPDQTSDGPPLRGVTPAEAGAVPV